MLMVLCTLMMNAKLC